MSGNPVQTYQLIQVESASREALVVIAYDTLLKLIYTAKSAMEQQKIEKTHHALKKAQILVLELISALRVDVWPQGENLIRLYEFMLGRLRDANMSKKPEPLDEILPMVNELRNAWQQAYRNVQAHKKGNKFVGGSG